MLAIVFVVDVVVMLAALRLRAGVATGRWNTLGSAASMTLIVAFAVVPASFVFAGTFRLLDATVCAKDYSVRVGRLIGHRGCAVHRRTRR